MTTKLKDALFYTLYAYWGQDYEVIAVTTEKSRVYFGRYVHDNSATHVVSNRCKGRFPTAEAARARITAVKDARWKHVVAIKLAKEALAAAQQAEQLDIDAALRGKPGSEGGGALDGVPDTDDENLGDD